MVFTALYMAPPNEAGAFGWNLIFLYSQEERRDSDQKNNTLRRFNSASITAGTGLQYQFTEAISAGFSLSYLDRMLRDTEDPLMAPASGARVLRPGAEVSARNSSWDGYLLSEQSAAFGYNFGLGLEDSPSFHAVSLRGVYEKSLLPGFRINSRFGALYKPDAPLLFESGPDAAQVNILPRSYSALHYAGLSLGLEKFLFRFPFGTVSVLGSWQMVYSQGPLLENKNMFDYGVLGSLSFYMSRIAIPAIGAGVSYNIPADFFQFSFMIGMSL
jgi:opacity protein-like surface antigen